MKFPSLAFLLFLALTLTACELTQPQASSNAGTSTPKIDFAATQTPLMQPSVTPAQVSSDDLVRIDAQGEVEISVHPINLDNPGDLIVFDVSMNTHSIDLSMDIVALATLSADNGYITQAVSWEGPMGGHHVSGKLFFPAQVDGKPILEGAGRLTLLLNDVDVPAREFIWDLGK